MRRLLESLKLSHRMQFEKCSGWRREVWVGYGGFGRGEKGLARGGWADAWLRCEGKEEAASQALVWLAFE